MSISCNALESDTDGRYLILPQLLNKMFAEENLPLTKLLNFAWVPWLYKYICHCVYLQYILYVCFVYVYSHLWNGDVWITLFSCACLIEQMRTYITRKLRDFPLKKSMEVWIIKAKPPEFSWTHFSYTIILPPKCTFSLLTINKTHGSSPNMPLPHMVTQDW